MGNSDINSIWRSAKMNQDQSPVISREEIDNFRLSRSGQIFGYIRKAIWTALVTNGILLTMLVIFSFISGIQENLMVTLLTLDVCLIAIIGYQSILLLKVKSLENYSETIASRFSDLKRFFQVQFPLFQVISSLSNPILVTTGVFYYLFLKYSEVRFTDLDDIIVMTVLVLVSYIIAYAGNRLGYSNLGREVEDLLSEDIYDDEYFTMLIERERRLRRRKLVVMSVIASVGILLLTLIIILNYTS